MRLSPIIGCLGSPYLSINCRMNSVQKSAHWIVLFLCFTLNSIYEFNVDKSSWWKKAVLYYLTAFRTHLICISVLSTESIFSFIITNTFWFLNLPVIWSCWNHLQCVNCRQHNDSSFVLPFQCRKNNSSMYKINLIWLTSHFSIPSFSEKIVGLRKYRISFKKNFQRRIYIWIIIKRMLSQILEILNLFLVILISNSSYLFIGWFSLDVLFLVCLYSMENMLLHRSDNMSSNERNNIYSNIIHFASVPSVNGDFA